MALAETVKGGLYMGYSVILFRQLSRHLSRHKDTIYSDKNKSQPERLACCVDYTGIISNFFEDLLRLDKFAESIEDELLKM